MKPKTAFVNYVIEPNGGNGNVYVMRGDVKVILRDDAFFYHFMFDPIFSLSHCHNNFFLNKACVFCKIGRYGFVWVTTACHDTWLANGYMWWCVSRCMSGCWLHVRLCGQLCVAIPPSLNPHWKERPSFLFSSTLSKNNAKLRFRLIGSRFDSWEGDASFMVGKKEHRWGGI